jgi:hypothetical protein
MAIAFGDRNKIEFSAQVTDKTLLVELAQQIAWIGSALSTSPFDGQLAYAKPLLTKTTESKHFEISFRHTRLHDTEKACWLPLFHGAVIATGFPIPERVDEIGLEISIELLAGIAGIRHIVEYEGGLVMKGFSHMFVPVRKNDNRVQWHAISSEDTQNRLTYRDALSRCEARASTQEVSFDDLQRCRAIVGWCSVAHTALGGDSVNYENIDYSGATDASSDSAIRCAGGSLGFQQIGTAALDFKFGVKEGKCHFQRSGSYRRIVSAAEKTPVVLYDTGEQRAWLVSASEVMLHMIQHRHWLEPFEVLGKPIKMDTNITPNSSAKNVLLRNEQHIVSDSDQDGCTFRDVILNIWSLLEFLIDQNVAKDRNSSGTQLRATLQEYLDGYEFKAVVEERSPFRQKQTPLSKTNGGWPLLVRDIDALVLLANGFEDIIKPAKEDNISLCRAWQRVPKGHDYLATSCKMLKDLYDVAGCRLNRKYLTSTHLRWHQGDSLLFEACNNSKNCRCDRLQQIYPKSAFGTIRPPEYIMDHGAAIFGHSGSLLRGLRSETRDQVSKIAGMYGQPNKPLAPISIQQEPEDCVSNGDLSGRSGSDVTVNSTPGSLSSCTTLTSLKEPSEVHELCAEFMTHIPMNSRKCMRLPDTYEYALEEYDKQGEQNSFSRKRTKSVQTHDHPYLSSTHCHKPASQGLSYHKLAHSDSILQRQDCLPTAKEELEHIHEPVAIGVNLKEGESLIPESFTHAPIPFRIDDTEPLRTLRRKGKLLLGKQAT